MSALTSLPGADTIARLDDKDVCSQCALSSGGETEGYGGIVLRVGLDLGPAPKSLLCFLLFMRPADMLLATRKADPEIDDAGSSIDKAKVGDEEAQQC